jgi:5-methylcytosine-specific restriction protein A
MQRRAPNGYVYQRQRLRVIERDGWRCVLCRRPASEMDHIVELADGGSADDSNCRALCRACHRAKSAEARRERTQ